MIAHRTGVGVSGGQKLMLCFSEPSHPIEVGSNLNKTLERRKDDCHLD